MKRLFRAICRTVIASQLRPSLGRSLALLAGERSERLDGNKPVCLGATYQSMDRAIDPLGFIHLAWFNPVDFIQSGRCRSTLTPTSGTPT